MLLISVLMISPMDIILNLITPDCSPSNSPTNTIERLDGSLTQAALSGSFEDDGSLVGSEEGNLDPQRTQQAIAQLQQKILKLKEQLRIEQAARDDNVAEYLKLAGSANDKQHSIRIKQVFEKKNQKSAANIAQLQRKLEHYHRRLRDAEHSGVQRQPKDVLRDMQQGLRDVGSRVITGISEGVVDSFKGGLSSFTHATHSAAGAVASKPREIASLIRHKFGSADNINILKHGMEDVDNGITTAACSLGSAGCQLQSSIKFGSDEDCSSATSGSMGANSVMGAPGGPPSSRWNSLERAHSGCLNTFIKEVEDLRRAQARLEETVENLKGSCLKECTLLMQALQEERFRCERLEEQLNDLSELHQNEILNLKQVLGSVEEKIAYQSNERIHDIQEALEACQTRISKMELQQVVQLEGLENTTARTLLGKVINVLVAVMAVVLVFVSTVANCVIPLMKTQIRSVSSLLLFFLFTVLWRNWDNFSSHIYHILHTP
ncbi:transmembrane and coiled-coil domains protein 1 [Triplophysa dalaica]|uniref:transmembrane and coiled-coil domains protein 1 n=1 Tax=Triplophysa dalaica TaxID=1582913 RepID=UPI0024DFBC82|nr:transmembrane and coiled-coil domains protein 1 [Triplophysa dalaica]